MTTYEIWKPSGIITFFDPDLHSAGASSPVAEPAADPEPSAEPASPSTPSTGSGRDGF